MAPCAIHPLYLIGLPFDRHPASLGSGQLVTPLAPNRSAVDQSHALALVKCGGDEGVPGLRPRYHANYYGAYARDPDGNML
jgi:non-ribosomal peptide synthetase component E (peptide arylation enzyme)